jgi:hypothetical protein
MFITTPLPWSSFWQEGLLDPRGVIRAREFNERPGVDTVLSGHLERYQCGYRDDDSRGRNPAVGVWPVARESNFE